MAESTSPPRRRRSGVVIPEKPTLGGKAAARSIWAFIRTLDWTLRYRLDDPYGSLRTVLERPVIFALWHNRLALSIMLYRRYVLRVNATRRMAALVSASRDGGMLAHVLESFRVQPVRGSSSRRGAQAVLEMVSWAERGCDLAITPDGPRGPRYRVQEGVIDVAGLSGLTIIPVGYDLSRRHELKSWDRFQIPSPMAKCVVRLGPTLTVPRETTPPTRQELRQELEDRLKAITDQRV